MPLFNLFYPKIDSNARFDSIFWNTEKQIKRKTKNVLRIFIIKVRISISFMYLRSKLTSEIGRKVGSLDGKTKKKPSQGAHFATFF